MTSLTLSTERRAGDRLRDVGETVYYAPAPAKGPGFAAKARYTAYVVGSAIGWTLATFLVVGVLATIFR